MATGPIRWCNVIQFPLSPGLYTLQCRPGSNPGARCAALVMVPLSSSPGRGTELLLMENQRLRQTGGLAQRCLVVGQGLEPSFSELCWNLTGR